MAIKILAYEETPLGTLCLRRRASLSNPGTEITEVTLNHEFLMSSYLTESERALTRIGIGMLPDRMATSGVGIRVLVGGLGLGYTAFEALGAKGVSQVDVVEFLPAVIGWLKDGLVPLADNLNSDDRLNVIEGDIYDRLAQSSTEGYDLIAIDVDHSPEDVLGTQSHGFYTVPGLENAKSHLSQGGVLGVWSYAEDTPLRQKMEEVFEEVVVHQVTVWNDLVDVEQTDWLFFGRRGE